MESCSEVPSREDLKFGLTKLILDFHERRPGLDVLLERANKFVEEHEERWRQRRAELEAQAALVQEEEGWTVVLPRSSKEGPTNDEALTTSVSAGGAQGELVGEEDEGRQQTGEVPMRNKGKGRGVKRVAGDFYRFQARDTRRNELLEMREKFEEDKKRLAKLRAARKFNPL